jgi:hypothetical protein
MAITNAQLKELMEQNFKALNAKIEAQRKEMMAELKEVRSDQNQLCARIIRAEEKHAGHITNSHTHINAIIDSLVEGQKSNRERLFEQGIRIAEIGIIVAALTKLAGIW